MVLCLNFKIIFPFEEHLKFIWKKKKLRYVLTMVYTRCLLQDDVQVRSLHIGCLGSFERGQNSAWIGIIFSWMNIDDSPRSEKQICVFSTSCLEMNDAR